MLHERYVKQLIACAVAALGYAIWYWVQFGQWCAAMWFGTAPPVIMLLIGGTAYWLINRIWPDDGVDE